MYHSIARDCTTMDTSTSTAECSKSALTSVIPIALTYTSAVSHLDGAVICLT